MYTALKKYSPFNRIEYQQVFHAVINKTLSELRKNCYIYFHLI